MFKLWQESNEKLLITELLMMFSNIYNTVMWELIHVVSEIPKVCWQNLHFSVRNMCTVWWQWGHTMARWWEWRYGLPWDAECQGWSWQKSAVF